MSSTIVIPDYIKQGQLYKELKEVNEDDDCDTFVQHVPDRYVFFPAELLTEEEIVHFMDVLKYWSIDPEFIPLFFFEALINMHWTTIKEELDEYDPDIYTSYANQNWLIERGLLDYAIQVQHLELIYYLKITKDVLVIFSWELYKYAIKHNAMKSFIFLENVVYKRNQQPFLENSLYESCCFYDCIDILQHIFNERSFECNFDGSLLTGIIHQSYRCLEFLLHHGIKYTRSHILSICRYSNEKMLTLFLSDLTGFESNDSHYLTRPLDKKDINNFIVACTCCHKVELVRVLLHLFAEIDWDTEYEALNSAYQAIAHNQMEILELLVQHGYPINERLMASAAKLGNLEAMKLLKFYSCPWNEECMREAALHRKEDCFMYAFENGCPRPKICVF